MSEVVDVIGGVEAFNQLNGMDTTKFNVRSVALYKGLQLEELIEGIEAIFENSTDALDAASVDVMKAVMKKFKSGEYDKLVEQVDRVKLLDSDIDSVYVAVGAGLASGADVRGAFSEIQRSNMSKVNQETGKMDKDTNGKVIKPSTYSSPDLTTFVRV
jgi:predicted HAD superfamily Cof-like phosphohydrolase